MTSSASTSSKPGIARPARIPSGEAMPPPNFDMHRAPRRKPQEPRPVSHPASKLAIDAETVIVRLEEAGQTLLCLPRTGPTTALRQTRHQHLAEALGTYASADACRPRPSLPSPSRITRMDQALAWITLIPREKLVLRRLVGCRCLISPLTGRHIFGWRQLARTLGADHKAIQRWHATGIDLIVATLNRDAAAVVSWDTLG